MKVLVGNTLQKQLAKDKKHRLKHGIEGHTSIFSKNTQFGMNFDLHKGT